MYNLQKKTIIFFKMLSTIIIIWLNKKHTIHKTISLSLEVRKFQQAHSESGRRISQIWHCRYWLTLPTHQNCNITKQCIKSQLIATCVTTSAATKTCVDSSSANVVHGAWIDKNWCCASSWSQQIWIFRIGGTCPRTELTVHRVWC